jgi:hypothetical protein
VSGRGVGRGSVAERQRGRDEEMGETSVSRAQSGAGRFRCSAAKGVRSSARPPFFDARSGHMRGDSAAGSLPELTSCLASHFGG